MAEESSTQSSQSQSSSHKSSEDAPKNLQGPGFCGNGASSNGAVPTFPIMYPALVPWLFILQNQEKMNHVAGIYAIHVPPFMSHVTGFPPNTLIPLTYSIPSLKQPVSKGMYSPQQHPASQRQVVVRRFQIAIHLDLLLILKLAAVIFLLNQDGSRQRLVLLVFFASLVYLYQTGALTPLIRWLSQGMQRAAVPPQLLRPAARTENLPPAASQGNENAVGAEEQQEGENEQQPLITEIGRVRTTSMWWNRLQRTVTGGGVFLRRYK